jgi:hypothetical protein
MTALLLFFTALLIALNAFFVAGEYALVRSVPLAPGGVEGRGRPRRQLSWSSRRDQRSHLGRPGRDHDDLIGIGAPRARPGRSLEPLAAR